MTYWALSKQTVPETAVSEAGLCEQSLCSKNGDPLCSSWGCGRRPSWFYRCSTQTAAHLGRQRCLGGAEGRLRTDCTTCKWTRPWRGRQSTSTRCPLGCFSEAGLSFFLDSESSKFLFFCFLVLVPYHLSLPLLIGSWERKGQILYPLKLHTVGTFNFCSSMQWNSHSLQTAEMLHITSRKYIFVKISPPTSVLSVSMFSPFFCCMCLYPLV